MDGYSDIPGSIWVNSRDISTPTILSFCQICPSIRALMSDRFITMSTLRISPQIVISVSAELTIFLIDVSSPLPSFRKINSANPALPLSFSVFVYSSAVVFRGGRSPGSISGIFLNQSALNQMLPPPITVSLFSHCRKAKPSSSREAIHWTRAWADRK